MPDWASEIRRRLAASRLRPTREMEIVEEIAFHLDERYQRLRVSGASEEEASAAAWRELDEDDTLGRALARIERPEPLQLPPPGSTARDWWIRSVWDDIRHSVRMLHARAGFSATVLLTVALSIGPVTAIVSIGNWLLWRPHPGVQNPETLALVWFGQWMGPTSVSPSGVSYQNLEDLRAQTRTLTGIAGVMEQSASLSAAGGAPHQAPVALVTADFFDLLGVQLVSGRSFAPEDDRFPLGAAVAVISEGLARSAFGSARAAPGQTISLNSRPFSVIGVAPHAFGGVSTHGGIQVWITGASLAYLFHNTDAEIPTRGDGMFYQFVVRAAHGRTFGEVQSELDVLARQLAETYPTENTKFTTVAPRVFPELGLPPLTRPGTERTVSTLLAIGGVLLLLGCANVANLLMFRAAKREREIALRKALGASRGRLLQLQLTESWTLSLIGAALGIALAVYLKQVIEQLLFPAATGVGTTVPIDIRVLAVTVCAALAAGTLASLAPGWVLTQARGLSSLGRSSITSSRAPKVRVSLAVLQLALSLTLLVGALLLVSTLRNLRAVDLGFDPDGVTVVHVSLREHGYDTPRGIAFHRQVLAGLQAHGEFEVVSLSGRAPFGSSSSVRLIPPNGDAQSTVVVRGNGVSADYFRLLSIPILRGRTFTDEEALAGAEGNPVIVSETLAQQFFGSVDAVGRVLRLADKPANELLIVGVARDSRWRSISGEPEPFLYRPYAQFRGVLDGVYMIRSNLSAQRAGEIANAIASRTAAGVPLYMPAPLTTAVDRELSDRRVFAWTLSLLSTLGFGLAALGLYGLVAQTTTERRQEFGIRLALGASTGQIVSLVARFAAVVLALGLVVGLPVAYFGTRLIQSRLFAVSPVDPTVYASAAGILTVVVVLACAVPAWRAMRVSPLEVLRSE